MKIKNLTPISREKGDFNMKKILETMENGFASKEQVVREVCRRTRQKKIKSVDNFSVDVELKGGIVTFPFDKKLKSSSVICGKQVIYPDGYYINDNVYFEKTGKKVYMNMEQFLEFRDSKCEFPERFLHFERFSEGILSLY